MPLLPDEIIHTCITSLRSIIVGENYDIDLPHLRQLISFLRDPSKDVTLSSESLRELFIVLVDLSSCCILSPEGQVLVFTALFMLFRRTLSVEENCKFLNECILAKHSFSINIHCQEDTFCHSVVIQKEYLFRVSLCSSILHCYDMDTYREFYFPSHSSVCHSSKNSFLLIFEILENLYNKYFCYSYLTFKSMMNWLCRLNELYQSKAVELTFFLCYIRRVIFLVNCNWENHSAVIRNKNLEIMKLLVNMCPQSSYSLNDALNLIVDVGMIVQHLSWRVKRKYLLLVAVLPKFGMKKALKKFPEICDGLVYSLFHSHLVSAGTNLYREVLKEIQLDDWQRFFFHPLKVMLLSSNRIAKENFMSHWMPETLNSFSLILKFLSGKIENTSLLMPLMSLYKIGRKYDLLNWEEINREIISSCLYNLDDGVRVEAFSVICSCTKTTLPPTPEEIQMVCTFIEENINGDNARARQLMVKSFKNIMTRVRDSYNCLVGDKENMTNKNLFLHWLRKFIVDCSKPGSNYQRKITSLYLLRDIFDLSSEKIKLRCQKYNPSSTSFENQIKVEFKSNDVYSLLIESISYPADDVRQLGCSILMKHFEAHNDETLQTLWKNAILKCSSPMFYIVECGATFGELYALWAIKSNTLNWRNNFDFFEAILLQAEEQLLETTENLLRSASNGAIHGTLGILFKFLSNSHIFETICMKEDQIKRLLFIIDHLISFLIGVLSSRKSSTSNNAPSFEEMSEAIRSIILNNMNDFNKIDAKKLSDLYELLLNCIWLNLKMSCLVASTLGMGFGRTGGESLRKEDVEKCAQMITFVLLNCRHKGVIESAGSAIYSLASFCSKSCNSELKRLPSELAEQCMDVAFGKGNSVGGTSITRRSAGLAIMLHKLVVADAKTILPLCVPKLLSEARLGGNATETAETEDLPHTRALHFLKTIVEDSMLINQVAEFMSDIAIICIKNFSSRIWAVRNAALLLFGPVVSKLVTQNGIEEYVGCITLEEIKAHHPDLVHFILLELQNAVHQGGDTMGVISPSLIPILSLCSRISVGIPQLHSESFRKTLSEFHLIFLKLLSSPIIAVRKLSAKSISSFTSLVEIPSQISILIKSLNSLPDVSQNDLHGKLLCIKMLHEKLAYDSHLIPTLTEKSEEINHQIKHIKLENISKEESSFIQSLLLEMKGCNREEIENSLAKKNRSWFPGIKLLSAFTIDAFIRTCPENNICDVLQKTKNGYAILEMSLVSLKERIKASGLSKESSENISEILIDLFDPNFPPNLLALFLKCINLLTSPSISKTMLEDKIENTFMPLLVSSKYGTECAAASLPFLTFIAKNNYVIKKESNLLISLAMVLKDRSSPNYSEEIRKEAGKALIHFNVLFSDSKGKHEDQKGKSCVLHSAISLLQDENTDVRVEAALSISDLIYTKNISKQKMDFSPQHCLKLIFSSISQLLPLEDAIKFLWDLLNTEICINEIMSKRKTTEVCNPFSHGISNVYAEKIIITKIAAKTLLNLVNISSDHLDTVKVIFSKDRNRIVDEAIAASQFMTLHSTDQIHSNLEEYLAFMIVKIRLKVLFQVELSSGQLTFSENVYSELDEVFPDSYMITNYDDVYYKNCLE